MNVLKNNLKCFFIILLLAVFIIITALLETIPKVEIFLQSIQGIISIEKLNLILLIMLVCVTVISIVIARKIK